MANLILNPSYELLDTTKEAGKESQGTSVVDPLAALAASDLLRRAQALPEMKKPQESAADLLDLDL
jgi:hypothetical protein